MTDKEIQAIIKSNRSYLDSIMSMVEKSVFRLFRRMVLGAFYLPVVQKAIKEGSEFEWTKANSKEVERMIREYANKSCSIVNMATLGAYQRGEEGIIHAISYAYSSDPKKVSQALALSEDAIQARRSMGVDGHKWINSKRDGMTISKRVWNIATNTKKEIEVCVQNCITQGLSADESSREVRQYLNNPSSIFRRVRDKETGELKWSKSAQNYHTGRGVYKSAYKNAMRLTRTEINNAFRAGEWQSYQDNDLVKGYEIRLSNNHTCLNSKGEAVPFYDICDELAGEYPKTFKWTGWHPQCRCAMIPILMTDDDFAKYMGDRYEAKLKGEDPNKVKTPDEGITEMPENFKQWFNDNLERMEESSTLPHFITDNTKPNSPNLDNVPSHTEDSESVLDVFADKML